MRPPARSSPIRALASRRRGSRTRRGRGAGVAAALVAVGSLALSGCMFGGGAATIRTTAVFSDVKDLVGGAPVQLADITVGSVTGIAVDGAQAKVTMAIRRGAHVPADVEAQLKRTTILGQRYVALVIPPGGAHGPLLANGSTIDHTQVVGGIQQFVQSGAQVFGAVNAAQLARLIDNSAVGFAGQSGNLRSLLRNFNTVLGGYASRDSEIKTLIGQIDQFSSTLAPAAQANAQSVANLANATSVLAQQSNQLIGLLQALDNVSAQGHSILVNGLPQSEEQINALSAVAHQLALHQQDLATILRELPLNNFNLSHGVINNYSQILSDIIVCGVPNGGAGNSPSNTCNPSGSGG